MRKLRQSPAVVGACRDKRLQALLASIDAAPDREAALEAARLKDEHFRAFLDAMLLAVGHVEAADSATVGAALPEGFAAFRFVG